MDTELFDLCKEVYKRTEWGLHITQGQLASYRNDLRFYKNSNLGDEVTITSEPVYDIRFIDPIPLYTSDYLLEKLPKEVWLDNFTPVRLFLDSNGKLGGYMFYYAHVGGVIWELGEADTPLKALLKLTIALDDAGELNK